MISILLFFLFIKDPLKAAKPSPLELRRLLVGTHGAHASLKNLDDLTAVISRDDVPLLVCYKGVFVMMGAKSSGNPFTKYRKFTNGRALIESAIARDQSDIEMRFLRYAVQVHLPPFLGYRRNLGADRTFLLEKVSMMQDQELKALILKSLESRF